MSTCTHALSAHLQPGDPCPWLCGARLTAQQIEAVDGANRSQASRVGGEPQRAPTRASIVVSVPSAPAPLRAGQDATPSGSLTAPNGTDTTTIAAGGAADRETVEPSREHRAPESVATPPAALSLFDETWNPAPEIQVSADAPAARWTDPATSHEAAASTEQKRRDAHRSVLAILAAGPASDFDLAASTGLKQTSIGKRRGELRDAGLVCEHDRAGVSDTGSACIRWALTEAGRAAA